MKQLESLKIVYSHIIDTFPFSSEDAASQFTREYRAVEGKLDKKITDQEFFILLEFFLASLKNSHTKLGKFPTKIFYKPAGYDALQFGGDFYLQKEGCVIGKIISIDGKSPQQVLDEGAKRIAGSTPRYLEQQSRKFMLASRVANDCEIIVDDTHSQKTLIIKRERISSTPPATTMQASIIDTAIGLLTIPAWQALEAMRDTIDAGLKMFVDAKIQTLIIDLRNNAGGDSNSAGYLAGHFLEEKTIFATVEWRVKAGTFALQKEDVWVSPKLSYFSIPVILLINTECFSSCEFFIAGMKDTGRAILIGQPTGGGSGNPKKFTIPFGDESFELLVATWNYYRITGELLEGNGVIPDILIEPTINDFKKDLVMERAVEMARARRSSSNSKSRT